MSWDPKAAADTKEARLEEAASADDAKASDALSPAETASTPLRKPSIERATRERERLV